MKIKLWFVILAVSVLCLTACASSDDTVITKVGDMEYPAGITQKEYDDALAKIQEHDHSPRSRGWKAEDGPERFQ